MQVQAPWWKSDGRHFELDASFATGRPGCLSVGVGKFIDSPELGVCLNPKRDGVRFQSVSRMVALADADTVAAWRAIFPTMDAVTTIAIEDFSLDTCMALLLFARAIAPFEAPSMRPSQAGPPAVSARSRLTAPADADADADAWAAWEEYVTQWEQGFYLDGADMRTSAACLLTVLGHSYLPGGAELGDAVTDKFARTAMIACLDLLAEMIGRQKQPRDGIHGVGSSEYGRAIAHLTQEQQAYALALEKSVQCQLLVNLEDSDRHVLVDALLTSESLATGVMKILARNDYVNSWTKKGFALLGIYRPDQAGSGGDMVVSVDPVTRTELKTLWKSLEDAEDLAWEGKRPRDQPRFLVSYVDPAKRDLPRKIGPDGKERSILLPNAPNEPWYDTYGKYTLLAAPKKVDAPPTESPGTPAKILGTRLDWRRDVVPMLWKDYFLDFVDEFTRRSHLPGIDEERHGKRFTCVRWCQGGSNSPDAGARMRAGASSAVHPDRVLLSTPTFHAWLASLSMASVPERRPSPMDLPVKGSFEVVSFGSVTAVVHRKGMSFFSATDGDAVFDPGTTEQVNQQHDDELLAKFVAVANTVAAQCDAHQQFLTKDGHVLSKWLESLIKPDGKRHHVLMFWKRGDAATQIDRLEPWSEKIRLMKARALKALATGALMRHDHDESRLAEALQKHWGLSEQRKELLEVIDRVDELMRQAIEARTATRQRVFGGLFSAIGVGVLVSHLWEPFKAVNTMNLLEWQLLMSGKDSPEALTPKAAAELHRLHDIVANTMLYEKLTLGLVWGFVLLALGAYIYFDIKTKPE